MTTTANAKTGELVKSDPAVARIEQMIGQNKQQMAALLGKHISVERLFQIAMTAVNRVPKLKECTTASILGCVMESSRLRLPAGAGAGGTWLIPRNGECTLIIDNRAIILMMKRDAGVETVVAEAVHAKDHFKHGIAAGGPFLEWTPADGDRGPIKGYVAASWNKAKALTGVIYKTVDEIKAQNMKKSPAAMKGEGPWATDPEWMFKKSVLRPLAKLNPGTENDDLSRAVSLDERAELDLPQNLHLLADPTAQPKLENGEAKTYTAPPMAKKGEVPPAVERIIWARDAAKKQGVDSDHFNAWLAQQGADEEVQAAAADAAWKAVAAKKLTAKEAFALKAEASGAAEEGAVYTFKVSGVADSEFNGEDAVCVRDDSDPVVKYFVAPSNAAVVKAAKAAQKSGDPLTVRAVEKESGGKAFRWVVGLAA